MGKLLIADRKLGHRTIEWAKDNGVSVKEARAVFEEFTKKGFFGAAYNGDVTKAESGKVIHNFDATAEEIRLLPPLVGG